MKRKQSGQGTVEFILTLFAFFTVVFMYVQVALGIGVANYVQYATYMASRALLSGGADKATQVTAATSVLEIMLKSNGRDKFPGIVKGSGDGAGGIDGAFVGSTSRVILKRDGARDWAWEQGASYKFDVRMYMVPLVPGAKRGKANKVTLQSESWLGRDPSEQECLDNLRDRMSRSGVGGLNSALFDNGC